LGAANGLVYRTRAENPELTVISSDLNPTEWRTVTLSTDGQTLLLSGTGTGNLGHLYVGHADGDDWSWYTISLLKDEAEQSRAAAISPDGQIAAIGVASGTIHFLATRSGNLGPTRTDVTGSVTGLRFTESGLVAASRDGVVERIDPCTGCELPARLLDIADRRLADGVRLGLAG
jgi:WD40 repeat protein